MCHAYNPACMQCAIGHNISIYMHSHDLQYSSICTVNDKSYTYVGENFCYFYKFSTNHESLLAYAVVQFWVPIYVVICKKELLFLSKAKLQKFSYSMIISNELRNYSIYVPFIIYKTYAYIEDIHISSDNAVQLTQLV